MRWFTTEWRTGDLTEAEVRRTVWDYAAHLEALADRLPSGARALAPLNLHDGQVQSWTYDGSRFTWRLLMGDLQVGYQFATITYHDTDLVGADAAQLTRWTLDRGDPELLYDELELGDDGRVEQSFHFWPDIEFGLRFTDADVTLSPATGADRR